MREFSKPATASTCSRSKSRQHEVRRRHEVVRGTKAYTKKEAIDTLPHAAAAATKPFIYLSAGVSNAEFSETLELAGESGVKFNGVLCGRATWKDGIPVYANTAPMLSGSGWKPRA
jgi:tagatose-1,6-bisphosphate aldolase